MKKNKLFFASLLAGIILNFGNSDRVSAQSQFQITNATVTGYSKLTKLPNFIKFYSDFNLTPAQFSDWARYAFKLDGSVSFVPYDSQKDQFGFTHIRFKQYINNFPVEGSMMIAHVKDGRMVSVNGDYYQQFDPNISSAISEQTALQFALKKVNAKKYKWENKMEEAQMKIAMNDPNFSFYPKGELVAVHKKGADYSASSIRAAFKFNIYAEEPLSRQYIYVDAQTGEIISQQNLIETADVVGTANTVYSGNVTMTSDNFSPNQYRLQETGRGNGIKTFNMSNGTTYTTTDFTNNSSAWNTSPPDQAATDAHWGAEMTYDYYKNVHNRNSIDAAGYNLLSYVHYSTNYVNAFWDGTRMTYGDGDVTQGYTIMTGLDVCGHEITHGLTSFTAALSGGEADALNEGNSDIFGTTIERYARPTQWDWLMGADISTNHLGFRNMADPHTSAYPGPQPNTYMGQYWDPNGEPHNNNGPQIYWYYLLCQGGSGTNDNNNAYNVSGITMAEAQLIEFRALTVYMTPNTDYANARVCTIQAANDIYGGCTPEVISTTNAWYAVGVGPAFTATVTANFTAGSTTSCVVPFTVNFTNTSTNASTAVWHFGDNTTSTQINPSHTYNTAGTFTVKLVVGGACGNDSITQTSYITVNPPTAPTTTGAGNCSSGSILLSAAGNGTLDWYTTATGGSPINTGTSYQTPVLSTTTTYYVESQIPGTTGNVGPVTDAFGTGAYHNNSSTQYLIFDVFQPCTLQTVWVDAGAAGSRTITLWDNAGNVIQNVTVNIPNGQSIVTLNLPLTVGTGFRLGGTMMNLYRNDTGPTYPYTLNGVVNITGSSAGSSYYYYCYNWVLQTAPCISMRTPVTATIGNSNPVTYNATSYDTVCLNVNPITLTGGTPLGGTYSGTGVSGGVFNPAVSGVGSFVITYTYTDINNCTGAAVQTINVINCSGINSLNEQTGLIIYPNPSNGNVSVEVGLARDEHTSLKVMNSLGQIIVVQEHDLASGNNKFSLDLNSLAKGIYFIQVQTSSDVVTKRVVIE